MFFWYGKIAEFIFSIAWGFYSDTVNQKIS